MQSDQALLSKMEQLMLALAALPKAAVRPPERSGMLQVVVMAEIADVVAEHLATAGMRTSVAADRATHDRLRHIKSGHVAWSDRGTQLWAFAVWMPWLDDPRLVTLELGIGVRLGVTPAVAQMGRFDAVAKQCVAITRRAIAESGGTHPLAAHTTVHYDVAKQRFETPSYVGPDRRDPRTGRHTVAR